MGGKKKFYEEKLENEQQMTLLLIFLGPQGPLRTPLVPVVRCCLLAVEFKAFHPSTKLPSVPL